jgi:hypothetical protein
MEVGQSPSWAVGPKKKKEDIFTFYMLINVYKIYTGPLSIQAQYSRLCPISSSFRYNGSLVT